MPPTRTPQRSGAALHIVKQREEYTLLDNTETKYGQAWRKRLCPGLIGNIPPARCVSAAPLAVFPAGPPGPSGGFVRWELFGQSGAQPSPFRTIQTLPRWLEKIPVDRRPRLWLDTGDLDTYLSATKQFVELVEKYGLPHEWHLNSGAHNEEYWAAHVEEYLRWYAADW